MGAADCLFETAVCVLVCGLTAGELLLLLGFSLAGVSIFCRPATKSKSTIMEGERSISSMGNVSFNDDGEYVWDGYSNAEQLISAPDVGKYGSLELAARIGQDLLQKNIDLNAANYHLRCCNDEQNLEIEHLNKQLSWLREVNESKTRMFEQLDVIHQELEAANKKLKAEAKEWKDRVAKYMSLCESREDEIQNLKTQIASVHKAQEQRTKEHTRRKTIHSCIPLTKKDDFKLPYSPSSFTKSNQFQSEIEEKENEISKQKKEIASLQQVIGNLKSEQTSTQRKNEELQREIDDLTQENQDCCLKLLDEREMVQRLNNIIEEYDMAVCREGYVVESTPDVSVDIAVGESSLLRDSIDEDESDTDHLEHTDSTRIQEDSLNVSTALNAQMPISHYFQIASISPDNSSRDLSLAKTPARGFPKSGRHCDAKYQMKNVSLVQEMDNQYQSLLEKYQRLLRSIETERDSGETQASLGRDQAKAYTNLREHADKPGGHDGLPEYKKLFREIFTLLNEAKA